MLTGKGDEREQVTPGAEDIYDDIFPRRSMTVRDVVTLRFPLRGVLPRREWKGCGGIFHLAFRNAARPSRASSLLAEYFLYLTIESGRFITLRNF